jgi:hypothetical protein
VVVPPNRRIYEHGTVAWTSDQNPQLHLGIVDIDQNVAALSTGSCQLGEHFAGTLKRA